VAVRLILDFPPPPQRIELKEPEAWAFSTTASPSEATAETFITILSAAFKFDNKFYICCILLVGKLLSRVEIFLALFGFKVFKISAIYFGFFGSKLFKVSTASAIYSLDSPVFSIISS